MPTRGPNPGLDRTRYALRVSGVPPEGTNPLRSGIHTRGYLPHVKLEGASYFVTFRLEDSLPKEVLMKFQAERAARLRNLDAETLKANAPTPARVHAEQSIDRDFYRKIERYLDTGVGACHLRRPDIADKIASALRF